MLCMFEYTPFIRTSDAELRGIGYLEERIKNIISPFFILTKSKMLTSRALDKLKDEESVVSGSVWRSLNNVGEKFGKDRPFFLDIAVDSIPNSQEMIQIQSDFYKRKSKENKGEALFDERQYEWVEEMRGLVSSDEGYKKWCDFVMLAKENFPAIIPALQFSVQDGNDPMPDFLRQVEFLSHNFSMFALRLQRPSTKSNWLELGKYLVERICEKGGKDKVMVIIDLAFLSPKWRGREETLQQLRIFIESCHSYGVKGVIVTGSSFPQSVYDLVDQKEDEGEIPSQMIKIYEELSDTGIKYGDYAFIHPQKFSSSARGWIPRIDIPLSGTLFFRKQRKEKDGVYARVYENIAYVLIQEGKLSEVPNCWGKACILRAGNGEGVGPKTQQGASPSFWISVRLNIHITSIVLRLPI